MSNNANIKAIEGQSLFDISLQVYGTIESVFDLLQANSGLALNDVMQSQNEVITPESAVKSKPIADVYLKKKITPVTGEVLSGGGIGFDQIGINLIVY